MKKTLISLLILLIGIINLSGQGITKVRGYVYDGKTGEPLPFVNVFFTNSNVGSSTDLDGFFTIDTRYATETLTASFIGYDSEQAQITKNEKNDVVFRLRPEARTLDIDVTVIAKKRKYRKKNNPAVELMRKVIAKKGKNRLEGQEHYSFDQYEKIQLDVNNITEEFKSRKIFNKFKLMWNYLDTSEVNGKIFLPIYLQEINSKVYYRQNPQTKKEHRDAINLTKFDETLDDKSLTDLLDFLYQDIDIYDNSVPILDNTFISPISKLALDFYRFYILDSLDVNGVNSIRLGFIPRNKSNFGFTGDLYVSNDSLNRVVKADFGIIGDIHLNFVRDLKIIQEFEPYEDAFIKSKDVLTLDFSIAKNGIGFYGTRSVTVDNFAFDPPEDSSVFNDPNSVVVSEDAYYKDDDYWENNRLTELNKNQEGLYEMMDTLNNLPAYKRLIAGVRIATTGYVPFKNFDLGPLPTFYSYNQVEGSRFKLGVETNFKFNKKLLIDGFLAYGLRDKRMKYRAGLTYTFNEDYKRNPRHYISAIYQEDVKFPGQSLEFIRTDNFLLSFRRGATNNMILQKEIKFEYAQEMPGFVISFKAGLDRIKPYGDLILPFVGENGEPQFLEEINTIPMSIGIEYSPNKQFIQGRQYRTPIINRFPIFRLTYHNTFDGFLGSDYTYHRLDFQFFKRFNMSILGHSLFGLEAGKIWGELPYIGLYIPQANQSFAYQRASFNMMNFMEFAADTYLFIRLQHFFKGFFFNKIPLFKKLKLREVITFKLGVGTLSDNNNPNLNPSIPQFSVNEQGVPLTYDFNGKPYMEGSVGITNIFKIFRIDLVKRFNYLDHPDVPSLFGVKGLGIRGRLKVEF